MRTTRIDRVFDRTFGEFFRANATLRYRTMRSRRRSDRRRADRQASLVDTCRPTRDC